MWAGLAKEMDADDIARIQRAWVDAALRARDTRVRHRLRVRRARLSADASSSPPHTNLRSDGYGGSLANRGRFWLETLEAVRAAVGPDCAIATRIPVHGRAGLPGIEIAEMVQLVELASDLVDLFDVNVGSWPEDSGTSRYYPEGHQREWTDQVRRGHRKPIVGVGRYTSPDLMAEIVRSGSLDIIGAARPAIADPFLPRKIADGRLDEIRECTGSNVCIAREEVFNHVGCIQNATAGEEFRRGWHPEAIHPGDQRGRSPCSSSVRGRPAWSARSSSPKRGFAAVHLVEAETRDRRSAALDPAAADVGGLGTDRRLARDPAGQARARSRSSPAAGSTPTSVLGYGAQIVVVATGSSWRGDGVQPLPARADQPESTRRCRTC